MREYPQNEGEFIPKSCQHQYNQHNGNGTACIVHPNEHRCSFWWLSMVFVMHLSNSPRKKVGGETGITVWNVNGVIEQMLLAQLARRFGPRRLFNQCC